MRWINLSIVVLFVAALLIFVFQNLAAVTVSFFGFSVHAPMAVVALIIYLLGMATGGSLFAALRRSIAGYRQAS